MPKPFDAATKFLTEAQPDDWVSLFSLPIGQTQVLDADLSTVTAAADRVFRVGAKEPYLLHLEFQGNVDTEFALRSLLYNAGLRARYKLPVKTAGILLRPFHGHQHLTGEALWHDPEELAIAFHYRVIRIWQMPVQRLLQAGLSLLPLAPVARVRKRASFPVFWPFCASVWIKRHRQSLPHRSGRRRMCFWVFVTRVLRWRN